VAIGDLNADGNPDLATGNTNSPTVSVLLGDGTGYFVTHTEYSTGNSAGMIVLADLNGDDKLDLVLAGGDSAAVLLGDGSGGLGLKKAYATGRHTRRVAVADVNADGRVDLVTTNSSVSSTVSVVLGDGDGAFSQRTDYGTGDSPRDLAMGELNGDGKPDLAVLRDGGTVLVLLNSPQPVVSAGQFVTPVNVELSLPRPSPFRSDVVIDFALPTAAHVRLDVYDLQGRQVRNLQDGVLDVGPHTRSWDGVTTAGSRAPTGVYLVKLSTPGLVLTSKALLIR